ncbi:MAG: DNA methylase, partial [Dehalococcoidia bacterium]
MFTHQDAEVWSDVALILWAAGLQVTAAWTVATETESSGIKQGNYVQGTVLLVLRKRNGEERGDLADIFPEIQREVRDQLNSMQELDDKEEPNFGDADYQLAAYAAVLRVLTGYATVAEIDVERELYRTRGRGERSPLAELIEKAVKLASDYLVPDGLDATVWRKLGPEERLYLKGVEVEAHGEYREGVYQEFARGYGVREYRSLLASGEANATRLKTPSEFKNRDLEPGTRGLGGTLLRQVLYAVYETGAEEEPAPARGRAYLRDVLTPQGYWDNRQTVLQLLDYLARRPSPAMAHWRRDAETARLLHGFVQNDSV